MLLGFAGWSISSTSIVEHHSESCDLSLSLNIYQRSTSPWDVDIRDFHKLPPDDFHYIVSRHTPNNVMHQILTPSVFRSTIEYFKPHIRSANVLVECGWVAVIALFQLGMWDYTLLITSGFLTYVQGPPSV